MRLAVRGAVAEVRLATGPGNLLDANAMAGLCGVADEIADLPAVRVVVVAGDGRSFCEGAAPGFAWSDGVPDGIAAIAGLGVPTVAALHGAAGGVGLALALACDLRVAARDARFGLGSDGPAFPGGGGLARLTRLIGPARTAEMALLGRAVSSRDALAWGLLTAVVPAPGLRQAVRRLTAEVERRGPLGMRYAKEAVVRALDLPLDDGVRLEQDLYVLLQTTADRREGVDAFLSRRTPRFHGR